LGFEQLGSLSIAALWIGNKELLEKPGLVVGSNPTTQSTFSRYDTAALI
jgi:hypothetical protein